MAQWNAAVFPVPPTDVRINGTDASAEMATKASGSVKISAKIDDPRQGYKVKLRAQWSHDNFQTVDGHTSSDWGKQARRQDVTLSGLKVNTLYKVRLWTVTDIGGNTNNKVSDSYTGASFWTNRAPSAELVDPAENSEYEQLQPNGSPTTILFDWKFNDPDDPDHQDQGAYRIRYRVDDNVNWSYLPPTGPQGGAAGKDTYLAYAATNFVGNTTYLWSVQVMDPQGQWSDWPFAQSFFIRHVASPPILLDPIGGYGTARVVGYNQIVRFSWRFRDTNPSAKQEQADIRWRVLGAGGAPVFEDSASWVTHYGTGITPGYTMQWDIDGGYFQPGFLYEWQVRTYNDKGGGVPSDWSQSGYWVAAIAPGSGNLNPPLEEDTDPRNELGCGTHRVFVYDRGGMVLRGEIKPLERVQWGRKRDDIANCIIDTNGFDQDCCTLLGNLQSWAHELVVYRDKERVFEGPITRITYTSENVQIEAKDVMAYLYRRVMRQGYNDTYRRVDLTPKTPPQPIGQPGGGPYTIVGQNTVVDRALQITLNALAYQDPNVLPYVTAIRNAGDATEQRNIPDYAKSAWEEIDDLAATAGLDYTTVGRRILYWDTHRTIGRLPEMRDGDFSDPVIVTEYGMNLSNWYVVTNNNGVAGIAVPAGLDPDSPSEWAQRYGPVEMVASAYGEQEGDVVETDALTPAELEALVASLSAQAIRGIANRWPVPVTVRVPDNSTLNPKLNLGINQLIPGVWVPLRATLTCRKLSQWQKLDSLDVEETNGQEFIRVTMSPAPHGGDDDPDLTGAAEAV